MEGLSMAQCESNIHFLNQSLCPKLEDGVEVVGKVLGYMAIWDPMNRAF